MRILRLLQGSPEWHQHRATRFNASDAPAMLGESPHMTREQLLNRMLTGMSPEVDAATQRRFDDGHAVEVLLRAVAEKILGEPLYAFVGVPDDESSLLSASYDGSTFVGDTTAESKLLNARLRAAFADMETIAPEQRERSAAKCLPIDYRIQLEQQVRVAQAERALFLAGELRDDGTLGDTFSCWYYPDDALWARIEAGWKQLAADRETHITQPRIEKVRAEPVENFPVMSPITMTGDVVIRHQLDTFKAQLKAHIARLPKDPKTDQEFANLEDSVKRREALEKALKAERERALRGSPNIAALLTAIDELLALSKESRLADADKVAKQKEQMRLGIRNAAQAEFDAHVRSWNDKLGRPLLSTSKGTCPDAAIAHEMSGKKSVKGWREGAAKAVNDAKIAVTLLGEQLQANLTAYAELCSGYEPLFRDIDTLLFKDIEAFRLICSGRIAEEQGRVAAAAEKERERIRTEEAARIQREQQDRVALEQRQREEQEAQERHQRESNDAALQAQQQPVAAPAANVVPIARPAAPSAAPTLRLGVINQRIAPLSIDAAGLQAMGFPPAATDKSAKLYHEADFGRIVDSIVAQLRKAQADHQQLEAA